MKKFDFAEVITAAALCLCLLAGCGQGGESPAPAESPIVDLGAGEADMFTDRDIRAEYDQAVHITLDGASAAAGGSGVEIDGATVTLREEGVYHISGSLDGRLVVDAGSADKLQLVLDGADIRCAGDAALTVTKADKVFVTLVGENSLAGDGDGAVFSRSDLTFNGDGSLTVTSQKNGVECRDDLVLAGGSFHITAAGHGLKANDSVRIRDASLDIRAGKDGIHAENKDDGEKGFVYLAGGSLQMICGGDGISAGAWLYAGDGTVTILAGGGYTAGDRDSSSAKGLKAGGDLLIEGGSFTINSADDAVHADGSAEIRGGTLTLSTGDDGVHAEGKLAITAGTVAITHSYEGMEALHLIVTGGDITLSAENDGLNAAGGLDGGSTGSIRISGGKVDITARGDGIDANGSLEITGGHIRVAGPTQGDTAILDFDTTGTITGGTFLGTGADFMVQPFSDSTQGVIVANVGRQEAGTELVLTDAEGNVVLRHVAGMEFEVVILSDGGIVKGEAYGLRVGGAVVQVEAG